MWQVGSMKGSGGRVLCHGVAQVFGAESMPACFCAWAGAPAASTRENTSAAEMGRMVVTLSEEALPEDYAACAKSALWPLLQRDDVPCRTRAECGFDGLVPADDVGDQHRWR